METCLHRYRLPRNLFASIARTLSSLHNKRSGFPRMIVLFARLISVLEEIGESFLVVSSTRISHFRTNISTGLDRCWEEYKRLVGAVAEKQEAG